jgi:hypothetical protein
MGHDPPTSQSQVEARVVKTLLGAAAAVLAVLASASPSIAVAAGTYPVRACNFAPSGVNNSWVWGTNDPIEPSPYAEHSNCPYLTAGLGMTADQEGGLSTTDVLGLSSGTTNGMSAAWTFHSAPGTKATELVYERYIGHQLDGFNDWSPALRADGTIIPSETCLDTVEDGETCAVGGPPGKAPEPARITGLSASELSLGITCQAPPEDECVTGASQHQVWATLYGAIVTVSDPTPPTLGTPSGGLWQPGATADFHKGTESVTVDAQDVGGGVGEITLSADGKAAEIYTAACDYTFAQPCPTSTGLQTLTLPTAQLSDGNHTLTLVATDAAGNLSTMATREITVENNPPPAPLDVKATPIQANSSSFTVTWADPPNQIAPITGALYQVCPATSPAPCSTPLPALATGPAAVTVPGPGSWTIAVWLTNAAGNTNPANAGRSSVTVRAATSDNPGGTGHSTTSTPTIHVSGTVHHRQLILHVTGPVNGRVRVSFTGRLRGKIIAFAAKTTTLKRGHLTTIFRIGPQTAARALIRVTAKLGYAHGVTTTAHRR